MLFIINHIVLFHRFLMIKIMFSKVDLYHELQKRERSPGDYAVRLGLWTTAREVKSKKALGVREALL